MVSRFSPTAVGAFELLFRPWMRTRVRAVHLAGLPEDPGARPLLLVANHVSWWDGFVLREAQRALRPGAPMYTVMLETELERFPFLRQMGVVGIAPGRPASIARALQRLDALLRRRPDAVVVLFPQGRIWPAHRRPLDFQRGVELFTRRLSITPLPVGVHLEPLNTPAPSFFVSVGEPLASGGAGEVEHAVARELDAILAFLALHGEDAPRAWPDRHTPLPTPEEPAVGAL